VGVPTAGASVPSSSGEASGGNIGLGFAAPVAVARTIPNGIIATGRATHSYFDLRQGDVITKVNGQAATSNIQLQELTLTKKAGDKVQIGYTGDGKESTATVTLGTQP